MSTPFLPGGRTHARFPPALFALAPGFPHYARHSLRLVDLVLQIPGIPKPTLLGICYLPYPLSHTHTQLAFESRQNRQMAVFVGVCVAVVWTCPTWAGGSTCRLSMLHDAWGSGSGEWVTVGDE